MVDDGDPASGADVIEPTLDLWPERVVITDYKSSDVRDPAKARQRAKDSLQLYDLRDGLRGDDRPPAGRGGAPFPRLGPRRAWRRSTASGSRRRARRSGPRPAGSAPGTSRPSPTTCRAASARSARSARPAPFADALPRSTTRIAGRSLPSSRASRAGAVVEADNLEVLARSPTASVDLAYADPPFGTGETQRLERRSGPAAGTRTRRGFGGREYRYEVVSDLA